MGSKYTSDEIMKMAVKKMAVDMAADLNGDGQVTAADARLASQQKSPSPPAPSPSPQKPSPEPTPQSPDKTGEPDNSEEKPDEESSFTPSGSYQYIPDEGLSIMSSALLDKILNYSEQNSDFDINSDKLYNQYREMYTKNASLSAENTFGLASSLTGGYGNSYAASAASAAYNSYMSSLTDKAIEIEQLNDSRKKAELNNLYSALDAVNKLEDRNYGRFKDNLSLAFEAAKQGDYSILEDLGINASKLKDSDLLEKAETAAKYGDYSYLEALGIDISSILNQEKLKKAVQAAEYGDYSYLEELGIDASSRMEQEELKKAVQAAEYGDYSYLKKLGINISSLLEQDKLKKAVQAAEYGDYSYLNSMGINTSVLKYNELLKMAAIIADYGDYSALEMLGIDVSSLKENDQLERALALAKYGDYSLLGSFSGNLSGMKQKISSTIQKGAQEAYSSGGYFSLLSYLNKQVGYGQINESAKKQIISVVTGGKYGS
ncbi:MAG: hypothetical protein J1E34_03420 [Oscillospiraceae bacterium]|nr:hypothetical protein [Oscillospiraceae bacterium]